MTNFIDDISGKRKKTVVEKNMFETYIKENPIPSPHVALEEGAKNDDEKLRWDLLPFDALEEIVKVYTFGAGKYEDENWRTGIRWRRILSAIFRHIVSFALCRETDEESGLQHLAHAGWGILTLIWYSKNRRQFDDRYLMLDNTKKS